MIEFDRNHRSNGSFELCKNTKNFSASNFFAFSCRNKKIFFSIFAILNNKELCWI